MAGGNAKRSRDDRLPRRRVRTSEVLASSRSSRTDELGDANLEEYDDFADRLNNTSDQAISGDSSCFSDSGLSKGKRKWTVKLVGISLLILVGIGLYGIMSYYAMDFTMKANPLLRPKPQKDEVKASRPVTQSKEGKGDWRTDLRLKGSKYRLLSEEEIKYTNGGPMYLVIAGHVFDVSTGGKMYAEDSGYHGFIGKDGTRAFVSGKFDEEGLVPDLEGLAPEDIKAVSGWINFYMFHEKYKFVGILKGWYFDELKKPTKNLKELIKNVELAERSERAQLKVEEQFPSCNVEWTADTGSRLWCSASSGGITREWVGVPRVFTDDGKSPRCACVNQEDLQDSRIKEYEGCPKSSIECRMKD